MSAQVEEVVRGADALDAKDVAPDRRDLRLELARMDFGAVGAGEEAAYLVGGAVELAASLRGGAVEEIDGAPEELIDVGFEARVGECGDERIEDVGERRLQGVRFGQWSGVGLVREGTIAAELQLLEDACAAVDRLLQAPIGAVEGASPGTQLERLAAVELTRELRRLYGS